MTYQNPEHAFNAAIKAGRLSEDENAPNFAGNFMYMGTTDQDQDLFKQIDTRVYLSRLDAEVMFKSYKFKK